MFPQKTKWFEKNIGWEDLGEVESVYTGIEGKRNFEIHIFCKTTINIGKENDELFKFCPRCMVKVNSTI